MFDNLTFDEIRKTLETIKNDLATIDNDDARADYEHARAICETLDDVTSEEVNAVFTRDFTRVFASLLSLAMRVEMAREIRGSENVLAKLCGDEEFTINAETLAADVFFMIDVVSRMFWTRLVLDVNKEEEDKDDE